MGLVAGNTTALDHRLMEDRQTRASPDLTMAVTTEITLGRGEHGSAPGAVGIVALHAPFAGRPVDDFGAALDRILVTFDAEDSSLCAQQVGMLRLVPGVTVGAFGGGRMGEARGQNLLDAAVTRGAELGLLGSQKGVVVGGMGCVADQAFAFDCGHVAGSARAARGVVAIETETGTGCRGGDGSRLVVAAVTGDLGMYGCPQEPLAGRAVWGVAARAVRRGHREPSMCGGKSIGVVMTTAAQRLPRLVQKCRLVGSVWAMAGQTVVGHRRVEHGALEVASRVAAGAELSLGGGEDRRMVRAVRVVASGTAPHLGVLVSRFESEGLRLVATQAELRLFDLEPQGPHQTVRTVTGRAVPLRQGRVGYGQILAHLGMTAGAGSPLLESGTALELSLGGEGGQDSEEQDDGETSL